MPLIYSYCMVLASSSRRSPLIRSQPNILPLLRNHTQGKPCWAMLHNLAQGKPCLPLLHNHCAIVLRPKITESAVLIATAWLLASSSRCSLFFPKIYRAGVKRALKHALNVQTAHYLGRNQTLYPCCTTTHGVNIQCMMHR